jgi:hypothetical protein
MDDYIHKQTKVTALQIDDFSLSVKDELEKLGIKYITYDTEKMTSLYKIKTLEGDMFANTGDYIVRGTYGELYPVKKEIFENIYERIHDERKA